MNDPFTLKESMAMKINGTVEYNKITFCHTQLSQISIKDDLPVSPKPSYEIFLPKINSWNYINL